MKKGRHAPSTWDHYMPVLLMGNWKLVHSDSGVGLGRMARLARMTSAGGARPSEALWVRLRGVGSYLRMRDMSIVVLHRVHCLLDERSQRLGTS